LSSCAFFSPLHKTELHSFECSTHFGKKNSAIVNVLHLLPKKTVRFECFSCFAKKTKKQHDFQYSTGMAKNKKVLHSNCSANILFFCSALGSQPETFY
jgi:hypothetical protein